MKPRRKKRYGGHKAQTRGIIAAAAKLGVTRITLWRVVNGKTNSPRLLARYRQLISKNVSNPTTEQKYDHKFESTPGRSRRHQSPRR